jgi:glycosyltransferase involved in cell wall biosynthesis
MRVWLVTSAFPEVSEAYVGVEVRALQRADVDVRVLTLRPRSKLTSKLLPQWGIDETRVSNFSARTLWRAAAFILMQPYKAAWTLAWLIAVSWRRPLLLARCLVLLPRIFEMFTAVQAQRPEVLHLFWGHYPAVLGMMVRRWVPETTVSLSLSAYDLLYAFPPTVKLAKVADCVWTIAECNREQLATIGIDPAGVRVAFHGIDLDLVPKDCSTKHPAKIVTTGRLVRGKGMEYVLRAVAAASERGADARLVVLGDGPDRARLEELTSSLGLSSRVVFRGNVAHETVFQELQDASVFMLLSEWYAERLPNVVKEALACRCVCIVSDTPGIMELMQPLEHRYVMPAREWQRAADCLNQVLADPARFEADREAGRSFVFARLDADRVARAKIDVWRAVQRRSLQPLQS